ncbi:unnamed protein product [Gordionus sp. m RMFG-2023]|uniref:single-stranded DNA-binding protein, mitochondrial-like n=1 Tax=Gordionus sp. m RMFG-2023 TaxID=3053472 RepID=UPI0030DF5049
MFLNSIRKFHPSSRNFEKSFNNVILLGRTGKNVEIRGPPEKPFAVFSLCTQSRFKNPEGIWDQKSQWHRIYAFKPFLKDILEKYYKKGQRMHIQGYLSYKDIVDTNGNTITLTSIIADDIILISDTQSSRSSEQILDDELIEEKKLEEL